VIGWIWALALLVPAGGPAQDANRIGERAFQRCYSCHSVVKGEAGLSGPNLHALKDRPIASDQDFEYSKGLRKFASENPRWTPTLLDRFLTDPQALVPGNEMGFFGLKKTEERAAIVAYILGNE
jgi:cytochrome c